MLYAWVGDQKRAPITKGERTTCRDRGGLLTAVMPVENTPTGGTRRATVTPGVSRKDFGISAGKNFSIYRVARSLCAMR
ncbi:hypothetical protein ABIF38_008854 [Bradyrhizobium japonicum]|uniref:Uncharacterized protein n=1 Tax=Bradyrhizobium elkanii TaxID=29448 RepID=A0A4Y3ZLF1_BRAEL|nr:hypothetical protein [Bradyrhizobium elkanii]MCP1728828.1 hypothetical protein [Bradyrhizobium elkanii]MCS3572952.1 hypothetical protein [Bradyrhizobium elkanii]MCS3594355.1 hypothetical protein [Bradyrhizobium elkanii]MCS3623798.1 hypothetical protein [Bradyrhizobium elkanii]